MLLLFQAQPGSARRRLSVATLAFAMVVTLVLAAGRWSGAADAQQLSEIRAKQARIQDEIDSQNTAIDSMLARVGGLRSREDDLAAQLARKQAQLADAKQRLADAQRALVETRRRLRVARGALGDLLVSIYKHGEVDAATVLLNSDGVDDFVSRSEYLGSIDDYQRNVVNRVVELRTSAAAEVGVARKAVGEIKGAEAAIDARRQSLATSRAALEQREGELAAARASRRKQLTALIGRKQDLVKALSTPKAPAAASPDTNSVSAPAPTPAPSGGAHATINSDGTATAPANAPAAVKNAIAAGNQITNTPYVYGGGHGSFDSSGYDCSGSVSYVLHGGGMLSSPLDSTGFETWGEPGPGSWITVYANAGHAYMEVAGLRFDTSGAPPRWQSELRDSTGYVVRHPAGY